MPDAPNPPSMEEQLKALRRARLKPLMHDADIARAVESDRPGDLYRLLLKKRKLCSLADRPMLDELLNSRRLFAEKIKSAPSMFTLNGIGTSLYGKQEENPSEGTHIATLFAVLLFIPLYPLGQYLVAPAGGRKWYFLAKVPLNRKMTLWRRAAEFGAVALAVVITSAVMFSRSHTDLQLVNGLDIPVTIQLDSTTPVKVPPVNHRETANIARGRHHLTTRTQSGELIEELDVDIPFAHDVVAYNVLGAAPIYAEGVHYYARGTAPRDANQAERNPSEHYCGQRFIVRDGVKDVFVKPPQEIKMESNSTIRWLVAIDPGGWRQTLRVIDSEHHRAQATEIAKRIAEIEPDNDDAVQQAAGYVRLQDGDTAVISLMRNLTRRAPNSVAAHRMLQAMLTASGSENEARVTYRKLAQEHPDSPTYAYLRARAELPADAVKLYAELVKQHPNDPNMRRGYAWTLYQTRQYVEAIPQFEKFEALKPSASDALLDEHARALIAAGRTAAAVNLVGSVCESHLRQGNLEPYLIFQYGRVARLDPAAAAKRPPEQLLAQLLNKDPLPLETRAWLVYYTDPEKLDDRLLHALTNATFRAAADLTVAALHQPEAALKKLSSIPDESLQTLDPALVVLLAIECQLHGDASQATRLINNMRVISSGLAALKTNILAGVESPDLAAVDLELQAALALGTSRKLEGNTTRTGKLRQQALRDDLLQGFVTIAAKNWQN